jgi:hypothetical protein
VAVFAFASRVAVILALAALPLQAQQFALASQNSKNFGRGSTNPNNLADPEDIEGTTAAEKTAALLLTLSSGNIPLPTGVLLVQEIMPTADVQWFTQVTDDDSGTVICPVATCTLAISPYYGNGNYKETYLFIVNDPLDQMNAAAGVTTCASVSSASACTSFVRPPAGLLVKPTGAPNPIMLVNFHATWSSGSMTARKGESAAMGTLAPKFSASNKQSVIIAGDWNLYGSEVEAQVGCASPGTCVLPVGLTTLNKSGVTANSYDHFWVAVRGKLPLQGAPSVYLPEMGTGSWRSTVSDHLGVSMTIAY